MFSYLGVGHQLLVFSAPAYFINRPLSECFSCNSSLIMAYNGSFSKLSSSSQIKDKIHILFSSVVQQEWCRSEHWPHHVVLAF